MWNYPCCERECRALWDHVTGGVKLVREVWQAFSEGEVTKNQESQDLNRLRAKNTSQRKGNLCKGCMLGGSMVRMNQGLWASYWLSWKCQGEVMKDEADERGGGQRWVGLLFKQIILSTILRMDWSRQSLGSYSRQNVMNSGSCGVGEEWIGLKAILEVKSTGQSQHLLNIFMSDTELGTGNTKKETASSRRALMN